MLSTYTLKNGLKVASYSIPQMKSVFLSLNVKAGSIFDTPKTNGVAHFMEHILFEGTPSFPTSESLSEFIEQIAGKFNAITFIQRIKFFITLPVTNLNEGLKIASETFYQPLFPSEAIEKERNSIVEEIKQRIDGDWYKKHQFYSKIRYKVNHPLLLDDGGAENVIKKIKKADLVNYWSKFFYPSNTYMVLVGGFQPEQSRKLIENTFEKFSSTKKFPGYPKLSNADYSGRKIAIRDDQELKTCYIDLSFPSVGDQIHLTKRIPQSIIGSILAGLRSSRLHKLLRQQKGLVYGVSNGATIMFNFGEFYISTQAAVENLEEVITLITQELISLYTTGPTEQEINFSKNYQISTSLMAFDHPGTIANWIEQDLISEDKIYTPDEYVKLIDKVDKKAIMNFMRDYWELDKLNLVIQGPIEVSSKNINKFTSIVKDLKKI